MVEVARWFIKQVWSRRKAGTRTSELLVTEIILASPVAKLLPISVQSLLKEEFVQGKTAGDRGERGKCRESASESLNCADCSD